MQHLKRGLSAAALSAVTLVACQERAPTVTDVSPSAVPVPLAQLSGAAADPQPEVSCGAGVSAARTFAASAVLLNQLMTSSTGVPMYEMGALNGVGDSRARDINDNGQVVGFGASPSGGTRAWLWSPTGGYVDLGTLGGDSFAYGINNGGQVTGYAMTAAGERAFRWTGGSMQDLGVPSATYSKSWGQAINESGQIAGYAQQSGGRINAFRWSPAGGWENIGTLEPAGVAYAYGINNLGHVVGYASTSDGRHAFLWRPGVGMTDIGKQPGASYSLATSVNDNGEVTGYSLMTDGSYHGWYWSAGTGMIDVGSLGGLVSGTRPFAQAFAINNAGQITGYSYTAITGQLGGYHAFRWSRSTGMQDLGKHPDACSSYAYGTNEHGQSVGANEFTALGYGMRAAEWNFPAPQNRPPTVSLVGKTDASCSALPTVTFVMSDPDGAGDGPFTYTVEWGDGTTSTGAATPGAPVTVTKAAHYATEGSHVVTVTVADKGGLTATAGTTVSYECNNPPAVTISTTAAGTCSAAGTVTFRVADADGASDGPWTYEINWGDGSAVSTGSVVTLGVDGTVSHAYAANGTYTVTVTVKDRHGATSTTATSTIKHECIPNRPPVPTIKLKTDGSCAAKPSITFAVADPDGASSGPWAYTVAWGDGTTSTGSVTTLGQDQKVTKDAQYAAAGPFTVTVTVTDKSGLAGEATTTASYGCGTKPPEIKYVEADCKCGKNPNVTFKVSDVGGASVGPWTYTIAWGDGTTSTGTVTSAMTAVSVNKATKYPSNKSYTVTITVTDKGGRTATATDTLLYDCADANDLPLPKYVEVEAKCSKNPTVTFKVYDADGNSDSWTYTVAWGDGTTSTGSVSRSMEYVTVTKAAPYPTDKTYDVTITVKDRLGETGTVTESVKYACAPKPNTPPMVKYLTVEAKCGKLPTATFKVYDADNAAPWTYTIAWGDGTTSTGTVTREMEYVTVTKAAAYATDKTYQVSVSAKDQSGAIGTETESVKYECAPKPNTPPMVKYLTVEAKCGKLPTATFKVYDADNAAPWTYTIAWGDGTTSTGTVTREMEYVTVTKAAAYTTNKTYQVSVTAKDQSGATGTETESVGFACIKDPIVPKLVISTPSLECKTTAKVVASFTDGDANAKPWSYTIDWGDGDKETGRTNSQGNVPGEETHVYKTAGTYTVKFTVTSDEGRTASTTGTITVRCSTSGGATGCTRSAGYWKTHGSEWDRPFSPSADFMRPGSKSSTWAEVFAMSAAGGNSYVHLAHQWMAATLNVANGAKPNEDVVKTLVAGGAWLLLKTGSDGSTPVIKDGTITSWADYLEKFNTGQLGSPACN